jgi:SAM-dependent methyltransferase
MASVRRSRSTSWMSAPTPKDVAAELAFQATQAAQVQVKATPLDIIDRYRHCRRWWLYRKEYVFKLIHDCRPAKILDFGCGSGDSTTELAALGYDVLGIDVSPDLIALAEERARLDGVVDRAKFLAVDGTTATLPKEAFDLVLVQAVLHHVDLAESLRTLEHVLQPGGYLIIVEPVAYSRTLQWLRDRSPVEKDISPNERQLNHEDIRQIAGRFEIVRTRHFTVFQRVMRLVKATGPIYDWPARFLSVVDYLLLSLPLMSHLAATVVLLCRKPAAKA